jgi:hypothetical protein
MIESRSRVAVVLLYPIEQLRQLRASYGFQTSFLALGCENNSLGVPCYFSKHSQLYGRTYEGGLQAATGATVRIKEVGFHLMGPNIYRLQIPLSLKGLIAGFHIYREGTFDCYRLSEALVYLIALFDFFLSSTIQQYYIK